MHRRRDQCSLDSYLTIVAAAAVVPCYDQCKKGKEEENFFYCFLRSRMKLMRAFSNIVIEGHKRKKHSRTLALFFKKY